MFSKSHKKPQPLDAFADKVTTAALAVEHIRHGDHVFVGTGCAAPRELLQALADLPVVPS